MSFIAPVLSVVSLLVAEVAHPFKITGTPIIEWEGGPLVYRMELTNISRQPVTIRYFQHRSVVTIRQAGRPSAGGGEIVVGPQRRLFITDERHQIPRTEMFGAGASLSEVVYLHGSAAVRRMTFPAALSAEWIVRFRPAAAREGTQFRTVIVRGQFSPRPVKPGQADIERLVAEFRRRAGSSSASDRDESLRWMSDTDKLQFLPVLYEYLDTDRADQAAVTMYSIIGAAHEPTDLVPKYLLSSDLRGEVLFRVWHDRLVPLPSKAMLVELGKAPNGWVRLLTWATFPKAFSDPPDVLRQIPELMSPRPTPAVLGLVAKLDDPRFKVREEAKKELLQTVDVEPMLHHILSGPVTAEQDQTIRQLLKDLPDGPSVHSASRALGAFQQIDTSNSIHVLGLMAGGPKYLRATREAQRYLDLIKVPK